jgi:hypothetical protein
VKLNDPRPSASRRIVSKLPTPVAPRLRFVDAVLGAARGHQLVLARERQFELGTLIPLGAGVLRKDLLALALLARVYGAYGC